MRMWRWLSVLLILATVTPAATADDSVKLQAALAERFAAYQNLSLDWTAKTKDDSSEFESDVCHWVISSGRERIEIVPVRGEPSHEILVSDGTKTVRLWYGANVDGSISQFQNRDAHVYRGSISQRHRNSNFAAYILGVICMGPGTRLVDLVDKFPPVSIDPVPVNGVPCLAWSVPFNDSTGAHYEGVLVVNQAEDWLPVLWETTQIQGNDRKLVCSVQVTESVEVFDEIAKTSIRVPSRGEFSVKLSAGDQSFLMNRTSHVELHEINLGKQSAAETFQVTIPPGFDVMDETISKSGVRMYVSGGAAVEKQRLSELAARAASMNAMRAVQTVDASIPSGSPWAIWLFVAAIILAGVSLSVRRLRE